MKSPDQTPPPAGLNPVRFLAEAWQRQPVLFRGAFPGFIPPLSVDEVAGLACEEEIESRLVLERDGATPWEVRHGPFGDDDFAGLPDSHWTILVQDVDKWIPDAARLLDGFRFVPDWRIDDLMISIAGDQGSVGPHWDDYDVFLIQGAGRREWRIDERAVTADNRLPDVPLRIMRDFKTSRSWVLKAGDMLYLPPRLAHHGVALGDGCMTLSVGFRAPSQSELLDDLLNERLLGERSPRFQDPQRSGGNNPGLIDAASIRDLRALIESATKLAPDDFAAWLGGFLTRAKPGIALVPLEEEPPTVESVHDWLRTSPEWHRDGAARLAFIPAGTDGNHDHHAFVNGKALALADDELALFEALCATTRYASDALIALTPTPRGRALLGRLIGEGLLNAPE